MSGLSTIDKLTDHEREIVRLRCEDELTLDATARDLGRSRSTIKNIGVVIMRKTGRETIQGVCLEYGRWLEGQEAS